MVKIRNLKIPELRMPQIKLQELLKRKLYDVPILVITAPGGTDLRIHDETVVYNILNNKPVNVVASAGAMSVVQQEYVSDSVVEKLKSRISSFETRRDKYARQYWQAFGISLIGGAFGTGVAVYKDLDPLQILVAGFAGFGFNAFWSMIKENRDYKKLIDRIENYKKALPLSKRLEAYEIVEAPDSYIFGLYSELSKK